jgi:hypothetical protein
MYKITVNGWEKKTNEDDPSQSDLDAWLGAVSPGEIDAIADVEQLVTFFADDALVGNQDGYLLSEHNFYLYNDPTRGFVLIPWDQDMTFYPIGPPDQVAAASPSLHVATLLQDSALARRFRTAIEEGREHFLASTLDARLMEWAAQIRAAVDEDPHVTLAEHDQAVMELRQQVLDLDASLSSYLEQ